MSMTSPAAPSRRPASKPSCRRNAGSRLSVARPKATREPSRVPRLEHALAPLRLPSVIGVSTLSNRAIVDGQTWGATGPKDLKQHAVGRPEIHPWRIEYGGPVREPPSKPIFFALDRSTQDQRPSKRSELPAGLYVERAPTQTGRTGANPVQR